MTASVDTTRQQAAPPATTSHPSPSSSSSTATSSPTSPRKRRKPDPDSLHYILLSGVAGGVAGCVAKTSVAPLDRVKILFQTRSPEYAKYAGTWLGVFRASRDIYAETGLRGLLQGHSATLIRIFPYAAIKFMAYDQLHSMLMPTPAQETSLRRFTAGALAGITTTAITYPLELIRVRLAFESHHSPGDRASLLRTVRQIYLSPPPSASPSSSSHTVPSSASTASSTSSAPPSRTATATKVYRTPQSPPATLKPSLTHFYRGVSPTLCGIIPYAGTSFLVWGSLKSDLIPSLLSRSTRSKNRALLDLLAGGIAGAVGQTAAYPLDIVRRRMQVGPVVHGGGRLAKAGFWETAKGIYRTAGWRGYFVGLSIGYLKVVPMNAVSYATWVSMKRTLGLEDTPKKGDADAKAGE